MIPDHTSVVGLGILLGGGATTCGLHKVRISFLAWDITGDIRDSEGRPRNFMLSTLTATIKHHGTGSVLGKSLILKCPKES